MEASQAPHIAMFPTPGKGHLIPLIELARKLLHHHPFTITIIIPDDGSPIQPQQHLLQTLPSINHIFLPRINFHDLPENAPIETRITLSVIRSTPPLCKILKHLKKSTRLAALIVDLFGPLTLEAVKELFIPSYIFYPAAAMALCFALYFPELDRSCTCEFSDLPQPISIPGTRPFHASDLPNLIQNRGTHGYDLVLDVCRKFTLAEGILVNSFHELEPDTFNAFANDSRRSVYPVGPLIRVGSETEKFDCLNWLDKQNEGSVLYVSFGSGGTLSKRQWKELAMGLEMSGQRFLVVVRRPNDQVSSAAYFSGNENCVGDDECLWSDLMERSEGRGFVLQEWAPQVEVLRHRAVGGFLTHCGWNSILESIVYGVPLIAWPLYAEQRMNAVFLNENLKVAMVARENGGGLVEGEEISRLVKSLIEGEEGGELRRRMGELKDAAVRALEDGGSSTRGLEKLVEKLIKR